MSVQPTIPKPEPEAGVAVLDEAAFDPLGAGTVVGTLNGAVGDGAVVGEPEGPVGTVLVTPLGPTTPSGASSPLGSWGVGSKDTQPARGPRYTCGHACASAPRTVTSPGPPYRPAVKPTTTRLGSPRDRASTTYAPANCSQLPDRLWVRKLTKGSVPGGDAGRIERVVKLAGAEPVDQQFGLGERALCSRTVTERARASMLGGSAGSTVSACTRRRWVGGDGRIAAEGCRVRSTGARRQGGVLLSRRRRGGRDRTDTCQCGGVFPTSATVPGGTGRIRLARSSIWTSALKY